MKTGFIMFNTDYKPIVTQQSKNVAVSTLNLSEMSSES